MLVGNPRREWIPHSDTAENHAVLEIFAEQDGAVLELRGSDDRRIPPARRVTLLDFPSLAQQIARELLRFPREQVANMTPSRLGIETTLETVDGMQFDRGYISPYFVTDPDKMEAVLEDATILIHDKKISAMKDLLPILEKTAQAGRPLLIIAEDIEGDRKSVV